MHKSIFTSLLWLSNAFTCLAYNVPLRTTLTSKLSVNNVGPFSLQHPTSKPLRDRTQSPLFAEATHEESDDTPSTNEEKKTGILGRLASMLKPKSSEKLTTKELLSKMGLSALLSYGFVSNMSYCVSVTLAWFGFTKKTGLSPLAPGQWKPFLAVYAGFYVFNNIIRPIRIGISVGVAKYFDLAITTVQNRLKVPKPAAIGIVVFLANIVGTCSLMASGILLASTLTGVPVFPPK